VRLRRRVPRPEETHLHLRCAEAREALSARFDEEAVPVRSGALNVHLDACPDCRAFERSLSALDRQLPAVQATHPVPPGLRALLASELPEEPTGRWRHPQWKRRHGWSWRLRWAAALVPTIALATLLPVVAGSEPVQQPHKPVPCPTVRHTNWLREHG
jgi:predicted anti-sigma-YlaC factor YlaD